MAWTAPRTWTAGEVVTAAIMNAHLRDNLKEVWHEVAALGPQGSNTSIGTTPVKLLDTGAVTYAAVITRVLWSIAGVDATTGSAISVALYDNGSLVGGMGAAAAGMAGGVLGGVYRLTPSAGTHTYQLYASTGFATQTFYAPFTISIEQKGG